MEREEERHGDGLCADCIQLQCQVITHFFAFQRPVRVTEPNPNWSTVELRDYKNDWPWGPVTTSARPTTTDRGPTSSLQFTPHL